MRGAPRRRLDDLGSRAGADVDEVTTITRTRPPAPATPGPVSAGPTPATDASSCPYLGLQSAADKVGMRLDKITVLKVEGKRRGLPVLRACRHPNAQCSETCLAAEAPAGDQPAIEITSMRYPGEVAAHNAFVLLAAHGHARPAGDDRAGQHRAVLPDRVLSEGQRQDWACTFSVGTLVVVKTVVTSPAFNAIQVAKAVAPKF